MDERWDLVVAGAGPAGCSLAAMTALEGATVLLLEKGEQPGLGRDWIVDVESTAFEEAGVPPPGPEASWHRPGGQVMLSPTGGTTIDLLPPPVLPVRNGAYVRQLAGWAAESGAEVRTGCRVLGIVLEGEAVTGVRVAQHGGGEVIIRSNLVADCTGITGALRRGAPTDWDLGGEIDSRDIIQARREVRRIDPDAAAHWVKRGDIPNNVRVDKTGVMAAYSVESCHLDIEAGYIDILVGGNLGGRFPTADEWFARVVRRWPFVGKKIFGDGGIIPVRRTWNSLVGNGMLLLGDSACQVIPMHGSGTASALLAAKLATSAVMHALDEKRYDRQALWEYCRAFQSGRGSILAFFFVVKRHINRLTGDDIDALINRGMITAEDFYNGLVPLPFSYDPLTLAKKVTRGVAILPLLAGFGLSGLKAERMMKHYQEFPPSYDRRDLDRWISGLPRVT